MEQEAKPKARKTLATSRTAEIIARLKAERAAGKQRQIVMKTKTIVRPMSRRVAPKPPKKIVAGRSAAAKSKAAKPSAKPAAETPAPIEPTEGQN